MCSHGGGLEPDLGGRARPTCTGTIRGHWGACWRLGLIAGYGVYWLIGHAAVSSVFHEVTEVAEDPAVRAWGSFLWVSL